MIDTIRTRKFEKDGFTVVVKHVMDMEPDLSWLEQDYADVEPKAERLKYMAQDKARLAAYHRGEWYMMGICVSILKQTKSNWANGGLEVGRASVWGNESDMSDANIAEVEANMIAEAFAEVNRLREALA